MEVRNGLKVVLSGPFRNYPYVNYISFAFLQSW